jgi:chromosome segregation ATPase
VNDFLGTLPQWLSAGAFVTFVGILLRFEIQKRRVKLDDQTDIRTHYSQEVAALRARIVEVEAHYRRMLEDVDAAHEECKRDRDELRNQVKGLKDELEGIKRQIARYSTDQLLILEDRCSMLGNAPEASKSAHRSKKASH